MTVGFDRQKHARPYTDRVLALITRPMNLYVRASLEGEDLVSWMRDPAYITGEDTFVAFEPGKEENVLGALNPRCCNASTIAFIMGSGPQTSTFESSPAGPGRYFSIMSLLTLPLSPFHPFGGLPRT